jgi:hypothetical protein
MSASQGRSTSLPLSIYFWTGELGLICTVAVIPAARVMPSRVARYPYEHAHEPVSVLPIGNSSIGIALPSLQKQSGAAAKIVG